MNEVYEIEVRTAKEIQVFLNNRITTIPNLMLMDILVAQAEESKMACSPLARQINQESELRLLQEIEQRNLVN